MNMLNEIERIREIMGVKSDKPLLMEQAAIVRAFRRLLGKGLSTPAKLAKAFKQALTESGKGYKGFKLTLQGFAANTKISNEILELLYEVLVKHPVKKGVLKSGRLYNKYLKTLGIMIDDATAAVISSRILLDVVGESSGLSLQAFKKLIRQQTTSFSKFIKGLFPAAAKGSASGINMPKILFLKKIFQEANVMNRKELTAYLQKFGYSVTEAGKLSGRIIDGKILDGAEFKKLFEKIVNNHGMETVVREFFGNNKVWKDMVKKEGILSEKGIKSLLGTDDLMTKVIYEALMEDSWFWRQKQRIGKLLRKKWFHIPFFKTKGFDMNLMKFIFGYIPFTLLYNAIWDWVQESEFKKSFMEKTQAMDGQLYATVKDHPGFFERVGGITVKEAQEIAATLKAALTSQWLPWEIVPTKYREYCKRDDNWKNECEECFGVSDDPKNPYKKMEELNDEEMKLIGGKCIAKWFPAASNIEFDATRWQGTDDSTVIDVYENRIPTVIAASAVAYYYKRPPIGNTSHRLKDDLNKMTVSIVPPLITQSIAGLLSIGGLELQDIRTFDVLKIVDQLPFIIDSEGKSLKEQKKALEDAFLEFWPTMPLSLPDTECYCTKLVNGKWVDDLDTFKSVQNCNTCEEANIETWYTRKVGPIPTILTRMLIAKCDEKGTNTNDTTELQSCINNTDPMTMNIMCVKTKDPDLTGKPIYSPEYSPESAEVIALDGVEVMFGLDGATAGKEFLEKVKKKFDKNYVPPKEDE